MDVLLAAAAQRAGVLTLVLDARGRAALLTALGVVLLTAQRRSTA